MIIKIYPAEYSHIDNSITIDGVKIETCNNKNYYINNNNKSILCESCDDEGGLYYYLIFILNGQKIHKYIGCDFECGSIFERKPDDNDIYVDNNGYYVEFYVPNIK